MAGLLTVTCNLIQVVYQKISSENGVNAAVKCQKLSPALPFLSTLDGEGGVAGYKQLRVAAFGGSH